MDEDAPAELTTFKALAFVYFPLPAVSRNRAELWGVVDPKNALRLVKCTVVSCGDDLFVRLLTDEDDNEELFAECPLPNDGSPLSRSVEGCIDSSRYFILRIVDRSDAKKHTAIGIGFRERSEATEFSAALDDYRGFLRRKFEAQEMRKKYEQELAESGSTSQEAGGQSLPRKNLALPPGHKIHVRIGPHGKDLSQEKESSSSAQPVDLAAAVAAMKLQLPLPSANKSPEYLNSQPSGEAPAAGSSGDASASQSDEGGGKASTVHGANAVDHPATGLPAGQQHTHTAGGEGAANSQDGVSATPGDAGADEDWTDFQG